MAFQFEHVVAPVAANNSPNVTAPVANRVWSNTATERAGVFFALKDGTSCPVTVWVKANGGVWVSLGTVTVLPLAASAPIQIPDGAQWFAQCGAPVGSPTELWATVQDIASFTASAATVSGTVAVSSVAGTVATADAKLTDGTARAKIWDGTNIAAVKAASTKAVATDPAAVVQTSPNDPNLAAPTNSSAIIPSDATDVTALANVGVMVSVGGTLSFKLQNDSAARSLTVFPGQFVPGQFLRVMVATTATVVGFSR